jgi:hypothetical protein
MDFDSVYASTPRSSPRTRQSQTYNTIPRNQQYSKGNEEPLHQNSNAQDSSVHLSRGINLNLLSRITKFEALDALSMPVKLSSLRPAHLRISRNSSPRKGTEARHRKRLSTIFSPSSESRDEYIQIEDDFASERDTLASSKPRKWFSSKTADSRKVRRSQASHKSANARLSGRVWETTEAPRSKEPAVTIPEGQNDTVTRKKTIREMIRLYDGSSDKVVSKGNTVILTSTFWAPLMILIDSCTQNKNQDYQARAFYAHNASYPSATKTHKGHQAFSCCFDSQQVDHWAKNCSSHAKQILSDLRKPAIGTSE